MKKTILLVAMVAALTTSTLFAQVPSYVPTNGLLGYWPFNGNANDQSGNANNGTVNGATLTTDRFGNNNSCYYFNGINNSIVIPSNDVFNSNNISVSIWISSSKITKQVAIARTTYSTAANEHFGISFNDINQYGIQVAAKYNNPNCIPGVGWQQNESVQNIMDDNFHHIVGTISGSTIKLYIDGTLVNTITSPYPQTSNCWDGDIQIGRNWGISELFDGKIDDIGIWNRALTQEEITNLYNANQCITNITVTDTLVINVGQLSFNNPVTWANNITIAPNPASSQININFNNITNLNGGTLKIINSLGQEVATTPITTSGTNSTMQLATWGGTGMYFVQIINPQGQIVDIKKIILQ
jgi:hypothetical protein